MFALDWSENSFHGRRLRIAVFQESLFCFWESEDNCALFYDDFFFENQVPDSRGFYFFDPELFPVVTEPAYAAVVLRTTESLSIEKAFGLWPFFEFNTECTVFFFANFLSCQQRRYLQWKTAFGGFRSFFRRLFNFLSVVYFIVFNLIGVGYACEVLSGRLLKVMVSNTNDLMLSTPAGVSVGCRAAVTEQADATSFFFFSRNYTILRNYCKTVRSAVFFNIYEYQGLLYAGEKKIKKITKRKQK
jgi:hypothetical protein